MESSRAQAQALALADRFRSRVNQRRQTQGQSDAARRRQPVQKRFGRHPSRLTQAQSIAAQRSL